MADVDDLGGAALDHSIAEHTRALACHLDVEPLLDDVDDLVHHEAHAAAAIGKHQDRLCAILLDATLGVDAQKRHELIAILNETMTVGNFNPAAIDLFQTRDQGEQNRFGLLRAGAEYKQRRQVLVAGILAVVEPDFVGLRDRRDAAELRRDSVRVDDHDYRPVAEYGGAGENRDVPQLRRHRLDHDLLGMEYAVDDHAEDLATHLGDDDEAFVAVVVTDAQNFLELDERQQLVAQPQHRRVLDPFDTVLAGA